MPTLLSSMLEMQITTMVTTHYSNKSFVSGGGKLIAAMRAEEAAKKRGMRKLRMQEQMDKGVKNFQNSSAEFPVNRTDDQKSMLYSFKQSGTADFARERSSVELTSHAPYFMYYSPW